MSYRSHINEMRALTPDPDAEDSGLGTLNDELERFNVGLPRSLSAAARQTTRTDHRRADCAHLCAR